MMWLVLVLAGLCVGLWIVGRLLPEEPDHEERNRTVEWWKEDDSDA